MPPNAPSAEPVAATAASLSLAQALADAARALAAAAAAIAQGQPTPAGIIPLRAGDECLTVAQLINEYLRAKARAGRSDRYLRTLRVTLRSFATGRTGVPAAVVTFADLERWLEKTSWSDRTKRGYLLDVRGMFNFAMRRGYVRQNPASAVELPAAYEAAPSLHTPAQVKAVLEFARQYRLDICRALAIRYFAGLRSAEVDRFEEKEILARYVEVTAQKSKTRARRLIERQPALDAWLKLGGELPVRDVSNAWRFFTAALFKEKQIPWPKNVTRHCFVSYHLAGFQSPGKTAIQSGHSEAVLFAHYRELTDEETAKEFWAIRPD